MKLLRYIPKLKIRLAAWHVGALVALTFFVLNINRIFIENNIDGDTGKSFLKNTDRFFDDRRMRRRDTRPMSGKVGILAIDEKSIEMFGRWPFPRNSYVNAFKNLKAAGVKWIGLDVLFTEPEKPLLEDTLNPMEKILFESTSPAGVLDPRKFVAAISELLESSPGDQILAQTFRQFENVVQATAFLDPAEVTETEKNWDQQLTKLVPSLAQLVEDSAGVHQADQKNPESAENRFPLMNTPLVAGAQPIVGFINNTPDSDGLVRKVELVREIEMPKHTQGFVSPSFLPSLSLQITAKYLNRKIRVRREPSHTSLDLVASNGDALNIPLTIAGNRLLLNHYGYHDDSSGRETPIHISLADATENKIPEEVPEILIMGTTTLAISDVRPSPLNPVANGIEHHVAAIENILRNDFLIRDPINVFLELFIGILAAALLVFALSKANALFCLILLIILHTAIELLDQKVFFGNGKILHFGLLHIQNVSIFSSMILFRFFVEEQEKRKVRGAFQQYLNPSVINELLSSPDALKLGGEKRELTVFFSDVRGFTSISEKLAPESLANLLNEYFTPMTDIVLESGGLLDKYIGDALMAVWGAPLHLPDHADRALHSSLRMLDALDKLRTNWKERNLPAIDIGCGINTGLMVVGNMGSTQRFDYTVLGDAVNLGSRLEGITKEYGVRVICSDSTRKQLKRPEDFILRELDLIKVKGKDEPITIYEVMRFSPDKKEFVLNIKDIFEQGLKKYRERDFEGAMQMMLQILKISNQDGPASVFLERCEYYNENPPSEDWDRVWVMKTK